MFDRADEITLELLFKPILLASAASVILSLILSMGESRGRYQSRFVGNLKRVVSFCLPIVMLGFASGYLTGISRVAAVGNLIPAMLTLVGGLSIFLFKTRSDSVTRSVGFSIFMFGFSIFYGIQVGAFDREYQQTDRLTALSDQELAIRNYRKNLGLPEDPPDWITGAAKN